MGVDLGNLAALRTFRVLRALKTVAIVPGELHNSHHLSFVIGLSVYVYGPQRRIQDFRTGGAPGQVVAIVAKGYRIPSRGRQCLQKLLLSFKIDFSEVSLRFANLCYQFF